MYFDEILVNRIEKGKAKKSLTRGFVILIVYPLYLIHNAKHMFKALRAGFTLIIIILVLQALLPEVATGIIEIILKMIGIANYSLDQAIDGLPQ